MHIVIYFSTIVITTILLIWWRTCCEWDGFDTHFPTKGHIILLVITSFIPIWNLVQFCIMIAVYLAARISGDLDLKSNRFTRKWFDIK